MTDTKESGKGLIKALESWVEAGAVIKDNEKPPTIVHADGRITGRIVMTESAFNMLWEEAERRARVGSPTSPSP